MHVNFIQIHITPQFGKYLAEVLEKMDPINVSNVGGYPICSTLSQHLTSSIGHQRWNTSLEAYTI